jgi:hypothetical protein
MYLYFTAPKAKVDIIMKERNKKMNLTFFNLFIFMYGISPLWFFDRYHIKLLIKFPVFIKSYLIFYYQLFSMWDVNIPPRRRLRECVKFSLSAQVPKSGVYRWISSLQKNRIRLALNYHQPKRMLIIRDYIYIGRYAS